MQRHPNGTPFKLRSGGSPFKNDKQRMFIKEGDDNRLVDVTKGQETKGTYTYKMMYNDLLNKGYSEEDANREIEAAKTFNMKEYGTHNPTAEGKTENITTVSKTPDKVEDVASPGKPGTPGDKMDTFTPTDTRMAIRDYKINRNRYDRSEGSFDRKESKYMKKLGKAGYIQGMAEPQEFVINEEGKEVPNLDYDKQMEMFNKNERIKSTFDQTPQGKRLSRKMESKKRDMDMYGSGMNRAVAGAQQGVNPNKGRSIKYDYEMSGGTDATEGSDVTYVSDTKDLEEYTGEGTPMKKKLQRHYGGSPFKLNNKPY